METEIDEKAALGHFRRITRKFQNVRNVSSPVLKMITVNRIMTEFMAAFNNMPTADVAGPQEADQVIEVIFYLICKLQSSEAKFLGARFIEECTYIDSFMHEEQIDLIEEYSYIQYMKIALEQLQSGIRSCEKMFLSA